MYSLKNRLWLIKYAERPTLKRYLDGIEKGLQIKKKYPTNQRGTLKREEKREIVLKISNLLSCFSFVSIDGPLLLEMRRMRKSAPEFFYHSLQRDLKMELASALKFSSVLGKLL